MYIETKRLFKTSDSIIGAMYVDGQYECFTLEDIDHLMKPHTSRIVLRKEGTLTKRYFKRYPSWFKGSLHLADYKGYHYIHIGNSADDVEGCIAVGREFSYARDGGGFINNSRLTMKDLYEKIYRAVSMKEDVTHKITVC